MGTTRGGVALPSASHGADRRRRATIVDVAARAGVSKGLVSFALNDRPGVAPATRQRILDAARALDWRPDQRARSLRSTRAYSLGFVLARPAELLAGDPFFPAFISGIETELSAHRSSLVLQVVDDLDAELEAYRNLSAERRVDGVIVADLRVSDPRPHALAALGLPAVTLGRPNGAQLAPAVVLDDGPGITAAVEHLVDLGHERIAFVGGPPEFLHSGNRTDAWRRAIEHLGLTPGPVLDGTFDGASGAASMAHLLALPARTRPTAVAFANDLMAIAGMGEAARQGLDVPQHVSVVGFDNIPASAYLHPALTTVAHDARAWGQAATRAVFDLVEHGFGGDVELTPAHLVVRHSTGQPRVGRLARTRRPSVTSQRSNHSKVNPPTATRP